MREEGGEKGNRRKTQREGGRGTMSWMFGLLEWGSMDDGIFGLGRLGLA